MVQLLAGIISLRRVLKANPGRSHGSADTLPLRHSANFICEANWDQQYERQYGVGNIGLVVFSRYAINYRETSITCWGGLSVQSRIPPSIDHLSAVQSYISLLCQ